MMAVNGSCDAIQFGSNSKLRAHDSNRRQCEIGKPNMLTLLLKMCVQIDDGANITEKINTNTQNPLQFSLNDERFQSYLWHKRFAAVHSTFSTQPHPCHG